MFPYIPKKLVAD